MTYWVLYNQGMPEDIPNEVISTPSVESQNLEQLFGRKIKDGVYQNDEVGILTKVISESDPERERKVKQAELYKKFGGTGMIQKFIGEGTIKDGTYYWQQELIKNSVQLNEYLVTIQQGVSSDIEQVFPLESINDFVNRLRKTFISVPYEHGDLIGFAGGGLSGRADLQVNTSNISVEQLENSEIRLHVIDWFGGLHGLNEEKTPYGSNKNDPRYLEVERIKEGLLQTYSQLSDLLSRKEKLI